jgi:hypothetical protein
MLELLAEELKARGLVNQISIELGTPPLARSLLGCQPAWQRAPKRPF